MHADRSAQLHEQAFAVGEKASESKINTLNPTNVRYFIIPPL